VIERSHCTYNPATVLRPSVCCLWRMYCG